jgi:hypothetical protein
VPDVDADEAWDAGPAGLDPDEARRVDVLRLREARVRRWRVIP